MPGARPDELVDHGLRGTHRTGGRGGEPGRLSTQHENGVTRLPRTPVTAASRARIVEWLGSPEIRAEFLAEDLKFSLLLLDQYEAGVGRILAERAELGELSWLGGPALGPLEWPRNQDGEPLAHIATILLTEAQALLESPDLVETDWPEPGARLPTSGYLEVFHHDVLQQVRPLKDETDSYVLVLSIESWTHLDGWFGDAGSFEVWMRASDLESQRFEEAWCMIRTD